MTTSLAVKAPAPTQGKRIAIALKNYPKRQRLAVQRVADEDSRLADLALSFPALLFVIAVPHPRIDAVALKQGVLAGLPLRVLAQRAGMPFWLRKLPPQAFAKRIGHLPGDALVTRQIVDCLPKRERHAAVWLQHVSDATRWGTDSLALWVARLSHEERRRLGKWSVRLLGLWAWYSARPDLEVGAFCKKPFHLRMTLRGAAEHANDWASKINLQLLLKLEVRPPRLRAMVIDGFDFVHLSSADLIAAEALRMGNCIMGYGHDIAYNDVELWSVRKDDASFATLSVGRWEDGFASITQIKGPQNKTVARDVALVARRWFNGHDIEVISSERKKASEAGLVKIWQGLLKPYWMAKREAEA